MTLFILCSIVTIVISIGMWILISPYLLKLYGPSPEAGQAVKNSPLVVTKKDKPGYKIVAIEDPAQLESHSNTLPHLYIQRT